MKTAQISISSPPGAAQSGIASCFPGTGWNGRLSWTPCCPFPQPFLAVPRARLWLMDPPIPRLLPVAPSWQSLGSVALHPWAAAGRWAPCPSLQESSGSEDPGMVGRPGFSGWLPGVLQARGGCGRPGRGRKPAGGGSRNRTLPESVINASERHCGRDPGDLAGPPGPTGRKLGQGLVGTGALGLLWCAICVLLRPESPVFRQRT